MFVPGERVEATSSYLWASLLAPFELVGFTSVQPSKVLGLLFAAGTIVVALLLLKRLRSGVSRTALMLTGIVGYPDRVPRGCTAPRGLRSWCCSSALELRQPSPGFLLPMRDLKPWFGWLLLLFERFDAPSSVPSTRAVVRRVTDATVQCDGDSFDRCRSHDLHRRSLPDLGIGAT